MADNHKNITDQVFQKRLEVDRRILYLMLFGLFCGVLIVLLANVSVNTAAGMRAYVAGEGYYTKAQKNASFELSQYISTADSVHYERFLEHIKVNVSDRKAREEMSSGDFNYNRAFEALEGGKNHPEDIPQMIYVFRNFNSFDAVKEVIGYWEEADRNVGKLISLAEEIHKRHAAGSLTEAEEGEYLNRLSMLESTLTRAETNFSSKIGELAQIVQLVLRWSAISLGLLLLVVGGFFAHRFRESARSWMTALRKSQERFIHVIQNSPDVLYESDLKDMSYEYVSPSIKDLLGYGPDDLMKGGRELLLDITHPDDMDRLMQEYEFLSSATESGTRSHLEYRAKNKSGEYVWISSLKTLIMDEQGKTKIIGNVRDISELKSQEEKLTRSLKEKEILLKEVHHRVKNNLAIISSMMELQKIDAGPGAEDILSASQSVINSISKVHEKLYKSTELDRVEMKTYVSELITELEDTFRTRDRNIQFELQIQEMYLLTRSAVSAGLIINEIITNAVKYAFNGKEKGVIRVSMQEMENVVQLTVANNGVPMEEDEMKAKEDSLGMTMISVLVDRLNGELTISSNEWTRFMICFDKDHVVTKH